MIGTRLGPYQVVAKLGEGGMGEVYRATDTNLKRQVAIKVLPASVAADVERLARFQREAEVLAALNHPNIAAIHGLEKTPECTALVMELVEGEDLSQRIARLRAQGASAGQAGMPIDEALPIARQIAEALEAAHEQGIIHRDLKPANIKVRPDGTVKVLDFGLAKALGPEGPSATADGTSASRSPTMTSPAMTAMGMILGTAAYMAPEQARGRAVDKRADVWAFGVVLYEMLTGRRAFEGDDISITLASVLKEDVDWDALPKDLPAALRRLLRRCLEKDPKRRLQAIGEARFAIEELQSGAVRDATDAPNMSAPRSSGIAWKVAAAVFAVASVVLGIVAALHFREVRPAREVVRFQIPAPNGHQTGAPKLSPDGRRAAFVEIGPGGPVLWMHSLESSSSWPLPGTERVGAFVIWSPDSQFIAFVADGTLKKVAASGGQPQSIADVSGFFGGAWSRTDVILFGSRQGIMQVPAAGGTPVLLLPLDASRKEAVQRWPGFLPDGRHVVYWSDDRGIYVGSLDRADAPKRVVEAADTLAGYAASPDGGRGYLLFGRAGSLMAQAFDLERLETAGEAVPISSDIGRWPASASENGVLLYQGQGMPGAFQLTWLDRAGRTLGVESLPGSLHAPSLSRDGRRVAIEKRVSENTDVWVIDPSRGTTTRVTDDPGTDTRPVFSPDGSRVAFTRANVMYQKSANGSGAEQRLGEGETTDWSPDGRFISFIQGGDLWALPLAGDRTPVRLAEGRFNDRRGRFSPDGKWIAYESDLSGRFEIYLQPFPSTGDRIQISVNGGDSAYWGGDGRELFFRAPDDTIMAVNITPGSVPQPTAPRAVFRLPATINNGRFVVAPDGQRFLMPLEVEKNTPAPMMVTLNWFEALRGRTAPGN